MKAVSEWKGLTKTERRAWSAWAKDHPVLLDDGTVRRVSGRKVMSIVVRMVVPCLIIWLVYRDRPSNFGYRLTGVTNHAWIYLLLFALMLPSGNDAAMVLAENFS